MSCFAPLNIFLRLQQSFFSHVAPLSRPLAYQSQPLAAINKPLCSLNYFVSLQLQVNFYLTSSCLERQKKAKSATWSRQPVPLCVNSPGRVSIHMALFGFRRSRKLFSGFLLPFITYISVATDIILLLPNLSSPNLQRTSLFQEVHFCEKSITYLQVRKYKYAIWLFYTPSL